MALSYYLVQGAPAEKATNASTAVMPDTPSKKRLASLDAFRGFANLAKRYFLLTSPPTSQVLLVCKK